MTLVAKTRALALCLAAVGAFTACGREAEHSDQRSQPDVETTAQSGAQAAGTNAPRGADAAVTSNAPGKKTRQSEAQPTSIRPRGSIQPSARGPLEAPHPDGRGAKDGDELTHTNAEVQRSAEADDAAETPDEDLQGE